MQKQEYKSKPLITSQPQLLIVTGQSGAGKSTVLRSLEDLGFFCVDNLPIPLLKSFFTAFSQRQMNDQKIALGIDVRGGETVQEVIQQLNKDFEQFDIPVHTFFLRSSPDVLIKRFQETRRRHPLASMSIPLPEAINKEQELLKPLIEIADITLDTSQLTVHDLRKFVRNSFSGDEKPQLLVNLVSFGYKHGVPIESNYIFDLRSLPNPYFIQELREFNGTTGEIQEYLFSHKEVDTYWTRLVDFIDFAIAQSYEEGRYFITIGIGCTGGKHRSVAFTQKLGERKLKNVQFLIQHRDVKKGLK